MTPLGSRLCSSIKLLTAVNKVYTEGKVRTGDLGGKAAMAEFTQAVIGALA